VRGDCGERDDRWGPHGGERGGGAGLGWFGVSWAGWLPGAAQVAAGSLPLYFFLSVFFFFCF
jgi:hypothetical protein